MANNYQGIIFEKLQEKEKVKYKTIQEKSQETLKKMREEYERQHL